MQLVAIYTMSTLAGIGIGIVGPMIPLLLAGTGASGGQVGLAATLMFTGLGTAALAAGYFIDRSGPKAGIVCGASVYAVALALLPLAQHYRQFLVIRVLEGVGIGILVVCLEAAINLIVPDARRGRAMGTYSLVFAAGVAIGPTIGLLLQSSLALPFFTAAIISGVAGFFMLVAFQNVVPEKKHSSLTYGGLIGGIWGPLLAVLFYALVEVTMLSLFPLYLTGIGLDRSRISLLFSVYASGAVVSPLIAGAISDKVRREFVLVVSAVFLLVGAIVVPASTDIGLLTVSLAAMGLAAGAIYPVGLSMIGDRSPQQQLGAANSLFTTAYSAGSIVGPLSVGLLMDSFGARILFTPLIGVSVAFLIVAIVDTMRRMRTANQLAQRH